MSLKMLLPLYVALLCGSYSADVTTDDSRSISVQAGGPYPPTFDCPMRQLALEFAQEIQPWLTTDQLQEIADALNGSPEKEPKNCTIKPSSLSHIPSNKHRLPPQWNDITIPSIYVSAEHGIDNINNKPNIDTPFKTLSFAVKYARKKYKGIWKKILLRKGRYYLSDTLYFNHLDSNLIISNYNNELSEVSGAVLLTGLKWEIFKKTNDNKNIYKTVVPQNVNVTSITGLRVNSSRAIRARYPNFNPEEGFGSKLKAVSWFGANTHPEPDQLIYPAEPWRNNSYDNYFQHYNLGIGGTCANFTPPAGYWCSNKTQGGGASTYRIPNGLTYAASGSQGLPNAPYTNPKGAVVQAWRPGHWASWMFEVGNYDANKRRIAFKSGGFQGARGNNNGDEYYVENIMEELDYENEFFFNESTRILYYYNNITGANQDLSNLVFEATKLKVLMNYTGTMEKPVRNQVIRGIVLRDTAYTYMDPHCMPSGGDWALQRTGVVYLDGTQNITITKNLFTRIDGIGISINRFNRNISIIQNEMVWTGSSAIASMGDTEGIKFPDSPVYPQTEMGWNGTNGNQPRFMNISFNYVHEIGMWEKQSSLYFQSKSCQNYIYGNIFYNGPRAGININDGFGGSTQIAKNLLFNTCRESGDHGPINTWDRQVYVTKVNDGVTPSYIKAYDHIYQNFLISNYDGIWCVDDDDGSNYYYIYNNFQVYATGGLKNNFGGHNIRHYNNIYGYVQNGCFFANNAGDQQLFGYADWFNNNICILNSKSVTAYGSFACNMPQDQWPVLGNNTVYLMNETAVSVVGLCGSNEKEFQSKYKADLGTTINGPSTLNDATIIELAKEMLFK